MPLSDPQSILILVVFSGVILAIGFDWIDMVLAALLGVCTLTIFGIYGREDVMNSVGSCQEPLALLFGGMVVAQLWKGGRPGDRRAARLRLCRYRPAHGRYQRSGPEVGTVGKGS